MIFIYILAYRIVSGPSWNLSLTAANYSYGTLTFIKTIQEVHGDLSILVLNLLTKASTLPTLVTIRHTSPQKWIYRFLKLSHDLKGLKFRVALRMGNSHGKSVPCLVRYPWVFCKWSYVLICHKNSQGNFTEVSCEFMGGSSLWYITTLTSLVTIGAATVRCFLNLSLDLMWQQI